MIEYFLPGIIFLGILTSYTDISFGKIKNKHIIYGLIYALIGYLIIFGSLFLKSNLNMQFFLETITNFLFSVALGFALWYFGVWSAADGKLFIMFSALIPISSYRIGYESWIPAITLLINIFFVSLLIMMIYVLKKINRKNVFDASKKFIKEFFNPYNLLTSIVFLFAMGYVVSLFLNFIGFQNGYLSMVLTMGLAYFIRKKTGKYSIYVMLFISAVRLFFDKSVYTFIFLIDFLILVFIWGFFRGFFEGSFAKLSEGILTKKISVSELKQGMILGEIIEKKESISKIELASLKKMPDVEIIKIGKIYYIKLPKSAFNFASILSEEAEGVTYEDIKMIKKIGFKTVRLSEELCFAPFMFMGAISTILLNGNILTLLKSLF